MASNVAEDAKKGSPDDQTISLNLSLCIFCYMTLNQPFFCVRVNIQTC